MLCAKCGAENPADKRFCGDCGAPLENQCGQCGAENPPEKKFCGDCGSLLRPAVAVLSTFVATTVGSQYPSYARTAKRLSDARWRAQDRHRAVCGYQGSTELMEDLDPEE